MVSIDEIAERAARDLRADVRGVSNVEAGLASIQGSPVKSAPQRRRWSRWIIASSMVAAAGVVIAVVIARDDGKQQIVPVDVATTDVATSEAPTSVETTPSTTLAPMPAASCDPAVLLEAVRAAIPSTWTSVTVSSCRDGFVRLVAIADQSACPSGTECRENVLVWMEDVDGEWTFLASGTELGCDPDQISPVIEEACAVFLAPTGLVGPVMRYPNPAPVDEPGMAALIRGVLQQEGDCLYVEGDDSGERYPILWPAGTTWDAENTSVIPPGGKPIPVGAKADGGGGFLNVSMIETLADSAAYQRALECVDNTYDEIAVVNNQPDAIARGA